MKPALRHIALVALTIAAAPLIAAPSDEVNERVPVPGKELERQWQVDCASLIDEFNRAVGARFSGVTPEAVERMRHAATLCGFIYQVNHRAGEASCPDYQEIARFLAVVPTHAAGSAAFDWNAAAVRCK